MEIINLKKRYRGAQLFGYHIAPQQQTSGTSPSAWMSFFLQGFCELRASLNRAAACAFLF